MTFHEILQALVKLEDQENSKGLLENMLAKVPGQPSVTVASTVMVPYFQNHQADLTRDYLFHFLL